MELFEPILHFFEQRWVHNIIWAGILVIGTAIATKVVSKTLRHLLNRDDNPLPASSISSPSFMYFLSWPMHSLVVSWEPVPNAVPGSISITISSSVASSGTSSQVGLMMILSYSLNGLK